MYQLRSILVAASPGHLERSVLKKAANIADDHGAQLTILDVVEPIPTRRRTRTVDGRAVDLQDLLVEDRRQQLAAELEASGIKDAEVAVVAGRPYVEVTKFAVTTKTDLVIVGELPPDNGETRMVATDVTQLIRACPMPVWVMCASRARKLRILALVDPDPDDPSRDSLNDRVLEVAKAILPDGDGELHVGHAWQLPGESSLRSSPFVSLPAREVDMMVQATGDERQALLDELSHRHGITELGGTTHLVEGSPSRVLPKLAERLNINVIVMGTVGRRGLSGLIMGNTAETMLREVRCSILTVKPDGFISPLAPDETN